LLAVQVAEVAVKMVVAEAVLVDTDIFLQYQ
jgi:hypothetical protein